MTNKYVHKKWASEDWNNDPAWLYENKPKKFAKYVKYYTEKMGGEAEAVPEKKVKKVKDDSSDDEMEMNHKTKKSNGHPKI